jgi:hypothetical protein
VTQLHAGQQEMFILMSDFEVRTAVVLIDLLTKDDVKLDQLDGAKSFKHTQVAQKIAGIKT